MASVVVNVNTNDIKIKPRKKSRFVKKALLAAALTGLAGFSLYKYEKANPGVIINKLQLGKSKSVAAANSLYSWLNSGKPSEPVPVSLAQTPASVAAPAVASVPVVTVPVPTALDMKKIKAIASLKSEFRKIRLADGPADETPYDMYLRYLKLLDKRCELAYGPRKKLCLENDIIANNINRERIRLALLDLGTRI